MKDKSKISNNRLDNFDNPQLSARPPERPISGLVQEMLTHVTEIIRSEFRLARAEVRQDLTYAAKASLFLIASALLALYALGFVLLGAVYALATAVPAWAAALIVGVSLAIIAAVFMQIGRKRLKVSSLKPDKTIQSLQENVTWVKNQTR